MLSPSTLVRRLPGLTNAHIHGAYGPQYRGIKGSCPFELSGVNLMAREVNPPSPSEFFACALVTGLENLRSGNTGIIDHYYGPLTREHVYAVATAYQEIGIRAWVLLEFTDLPWLYYTKEAYPGFSNAIPLADLTDEIRSLISRQLYATSSDLAQTVDLIRGWSGDRVKLGLALGNPLWCTEGLIADVAAAAGELDVLITTHVDESPLQRQVSLEQWGLTGVERMEKCGALSDRTIISHAVQIDDRDIRILADRGVSISHNPVSNLKLQVGIAQVGAWIRGDVNVCLGSDGQSSGDSQNLFTAMKFAASLADLNGLRSLAESPETLVLKMATRNAARFWGDDDVSRDYIEFTEPLGAHAHVWDDPVPYIAEVYVDGGARLAHARDIVASKGANDIVLDLRAQSVAPSQVERADRLTAALTPLLQSPAVKTEPHSNVATGG